MSTLSNWLLTDGYTIENPADIYYQKNFTLEIKPTSEPKAPLHTETLSLEIKLDPNAVRINCESLPDRILDGLIETMRSIGWTNAAMSRALNISARTIYTRIQKIDAKKVLE